MDSNFKHNDPHFERELRKYGDSAVPSREYLLSYLTELQKPISASALIRQFNITDNLMQKALKRRLLAMCRDGQLAKVGKTRYGLMSDSDLVRGFVVGRKNGTGFVEPVAAKEPIFLSPRQMRLVFPGDLVLARPMGRARDEREGVIVRVLSNNTKSLVGYYQKRGKLGVVVPLDKTIHQNIVLTSGDSNQLSEGDYVVVKITQQPGHRERPAGKIIEQLGSEHNLDLAVEATLLKYGMSLHWPKSVTNALDKLDGLAEELPRKDCLDLPFVTIDGADARDFDDAVFAQQDGKGWRLFVAIADVSHYVRLGDAIDKEAKIRGTSVYFPTQVAPMLPEKLSNELCSLNPKVNRLAMICEMQLNAEAEVCHYQFYPAVIQSRARLTYTQVAKYFDGKEGFSDEISASLNRLHRIYKLLFAKRERRGALEFDTVETQIIFDDHQQVENIIPTTRNVAHRLIEECMLAANVSAADFFIKHKVDSLFRVHPHPDRDRLITLREFLAGFGLKLPGGDKPKPSDYMQVLSAIKDRPEANLIQTVMLRSLQPAVYSPDNRGHFGLAYDAYTHFTSPIRRYPDLMVHRMIKHILSQKKALKMNWVELGIHCSKTERQADIAARDVVDWVKCEYISHRLGEVFDGMITGVTSFGLFVQLSGIYVEGLLHINELKDDYYDFDSVRHALTGRRTGKVLRLGDTLNIQIARVDVREREVDFVLA